MKIGVKLVKKAQNNIYILSKIYSLKNMDLKKVVHIQFNNLADLSVYQMHPSILDRFKGKVIKCSFKILLWSNL